MNTAVWRRSEGLGARTKGQTGGRLGDCAWTGLREGVINRVSKNRLILVRVAYQRACRHGIQEILPAKKSANCALFLDKLFGIG
jgi:hypothetical protein